MATCLPSYWFLGLAFVLGSLAGLAQAEYTVLRGVPVSEGQMRVAADDFDRLERRLPGASDQFILKETRVDAEISGLLARVRVSQVFHNPYSERLEALYVFPLPENSAVDNYSFLIGQREIAGEIRTRQDARRAYEQARDEGRKAALLEQERPNIFSQAVANIPPSAEVTVKIEYVHPIEVDGDKYVFRFPMVVGPRYIPGSPQFGTSLGRGWAVDTDRVPDASRITPVQLAPGMRNGNDVFISVHLDAGMPIQEVSAVTHELETEEISNTEVQIKLANSSTIADKDFLVEYRLAGPDTVLASLTHRAEGQDTGYLLLVLQPKWQIDEGEVSPREAIFLLDRSGSMEGAAISQLRVCAQKLLGSLNPNDLFQIVAFSDNQQHFQPHASPASDEALAGGINFVRGIYAGGGTELSAAVLDALSARSGETNVPRYLIMMTDALVGDDNTILNELQRPEYADVRVFPIAFGAAPNHYLISRAAELGRGFATQVTNQDNPAAIADRISKRLGAPYMTDLELDWGGLQVQDIIPERLPDLYAGEPLVIVARYDKPGKDKVVLRGNVSGKPVEMELDLKLPASMNAHDSIGTIWARKRVAQIWNRDLGQETSAGREEITRLGLQHRLVTQYTSFVAIEKELEETLDGKLRSESVVAMLPEGMTANSTGQFGSQQTLASQSRPYTPNDPAPASVSSNSTGGGGAVVAEALALK